MWPYLGHAFAPWYPVKNTSKHAWLDTQTQVSRYPNMCVWKSIYKKMQYLNINVYWIQDYNNHSLQLKLQQMRQRATTHPFGCFLDELCKPDVWGKAVQLGLKPFFKSLHMVNIIIFEHTPSSSKRNFISYVACQFQKTSTAHLSLYWVLLGFEHLS